MSIFTGSYESCKSGNLVSISGDKGASANFIGPSYLKLAPKKDFFYAWKHNTTLSKDENNLFYMREFYAKVLSKLDPEQVLNELNMFGDDVVILCYEGNKDFCHRHLVAAWLELNLHMRVSEIEINEEGTVTRLDRNPKYIIQFLNVIDEFEKSKK